MKLAELTQLIAMGEEATQAAQTELFEAIGQRAIRKDGTGWDWRSEAAQCECGLLLVQLPRPVKLPRTVVVLGQPRRVEYPMTHTHWADSQGRLLCAECADNDAPCADHAAEMCDTPNPLTCAHCTGAAVPDEDYCLDCRPYEAKWDRESYLGL